MTKTTNADSLEDRLLTIREVANLTGLAVGTLYHLVSQGRIPVVRFSKRCIRFRLSRLQYWFDQLSKEADKAENISVSRGSNR